jgi:hypothetical protein
MVTLVPRSRVAKLNASGGTARARSADTPGQYAGTYRSRFAAERRSGPVVESADLSTVLARHAERMIGKPFEVRGPLAGQRAPSYDTVLGLHHFHIPPADAEITRAY